MERYIRAAVNSKNINMPDPFLIKGGVIDNIIEAKFILIPCKTKGSLEAMKSQVGIYLTIASLSYCLYDLRHICSCLIIHRYLITLDIYFGIKIINKYFIQGHGKVCQQQNVLISDQQKFYRNIPRI